jgi:hypothetical protein
MAEGPVAINTPFNNPAEDASDVAKIWLTGSHIFFLIPLIIVLYRGKYGYGLLIMILTLVSTFYHMTQAGYSTMILNLNGDEWARADLFTALWGLIIATMYLLRFQSADQGLQYYTALLVLGWAVWIVMPNNVIEYTQLGLSIVVIFLYFWMRFGKHIEATVHWSFRLAAYIVVFFSISLQIVATFIQNDSVYAWTHGTWHAGLSFGLALIFWPEQYYMPKQHAADTLSGEGTYGTNLQMKDANITLRNNVNGNIQPPTVNHMDNAIQALMPNRAVPANARENDALSIVASNLLTGFVIPSFTRETEYAGNERLSQMSRPSTQKNGIALAPRDIPGYRSYNQ